MNKETIKFAINIVLTIIEGVIIIAAEAQKNDSNNNSNPLTWGKN